MNFTQQNQTLETNQLTNKTQNGINLNIPQTNQPNLVSNINNSPQFNPQFNPLYNPQNNTTTSPSYTNNINTNISFFNNITVKPSISIFGPVRVGLEPKKMNCPFCEEKIETQIETSTNIKALLISIGTLFIGYFLIQICKNKSVSCKDCEHTCPSCGHIIGRYYAM